MQPFLGIEFLQVLNIKWHPEHALGANLWLRYFNTRQFLVIHHQLWQAEPRMNRYRFVGMLLVVLLLGSFGSAQAHPGNTESDGGHYCWTNCPEWGETYGIRHFHDRDEDSSGGVLAATINWGSVVRSTF